MPQQERVWGQSDKLGQRPVKYEPPIRGSTHNWIQQAGARKIWAGDTNVGVIILQEVGKAMGQDEVTQEVHSERKAV